MKRLIAFDLDGTLALSKQPLDQDMGERLADLLDSCMVGIISGGDWPQFETQVIQRLPVRANLANLFIQPTTGTKLYRYELKEWRQVYADTYSKKQKQKIIDAIDAAMKAEKLDKGKTWGERIEDRGSQITFSGLGQQAPLDAKDKWDPDRKKRERLQKRLQKALPDLSINIGGSTSIDITRQGVDKQYGLKRLSAVSGVAPAQILFLGDAIFPGGNDYPAHEMGMDTIRVGSIDDTRVAINAIAMALKG